MSEETKKMYEELALRNGWRFSIDNNRPYFMGDDGYAVPTESTTLEDKRMLAEAIAEGSDEMVELILLCWENGINIAGPCSGIREAHDENNPPYYLHFTFIAKKEVLEPLYAAIEEAFPLGDGEKFPYFSCLLREKSSLENDGLFRLDFSYSLGPVGHVENYLNKEQADAIFAELKKRLESVLEEIRNKNLQHKTEN